MRWRLSPQWQILCFLIAPFLLLCAVGGISQVLTFNPWNEVIGVLIALCATTLAGIIAWQSVRRIRAWQAPEISSFLPLIQDATDLLKLDPAQFEQLVAYIFELRGFTTEIVGQTGDHGIDVFVRYGSHLTATVQCKRYRNPIGEPIVRECFGSMCGVARHGYLVTSGTFTEPARRWIAKRQNPATQLHLIDRADLLDWIQMSQWNATLPGVKEWPPHMIQMLAARRVS